MTLSSLPGDTYMRLDDFMRLMEEDDDGTRDDQGLTLAERHRAIQRCVDAACANLEPLPVTWKSESSGATTPAQKLSTAS